MAELGAVYGRTVLAIAVLTVTISYPVFQLIPASSRFKSRNYLFLLGVAAGLEPEQESPKATSATNGTYGTYGGSNPSRRAIWNKHLRALLLGPRLG